MQDESKLLNNGSNIDNPSTSSTPDENLRTQSSSVAPSLAPSVPSFKFSMETSTQALPENLEAVYDSPSDDFSNTQKRLKDEKISWTASEFIAHEKAASWYLWLGIGAMFLASFFILIKDIAGSLVVVVAAFSFGFFAKRQPRELRYYLDTSGLTIGSKIYSINDFRSFSVSTVGAFKSIELLPLKRFAPTLNIHYSPEDEQRIIDLIAVNLPYEEHSQDPVDRLMARIRF